MINTVFLLIFSMLGNVQIKWEDNAKIIDGSINLSDKLKIVFYYGPCTFTGLLHEYNFNHIAVIEESTHYDCYKVASHTKAGKIMEERFKIGYKYPCTFIFNKSGELMERIVGYVFPSGTARVMKDIRTNSALYGKVFTENEIVELTRKYGNIPQAIREYFAYLQRINQMDLIENLFNILYEEINDESILNEIRLVNGRILIKEGNKEAVKTFLETTFEENSDYLSILRYEENYYTKNFQFCQKFC